MIKHVFIFIAILFTAWACSPQEEELTRDFNSGWLFFPEDDSLAFSVDFPDSTWRQLDLPHDWSIEGTFSEDNPTEPSGGALPAGIGWYRKSFTLENVTGEKVFIDFDGVYRNSEVWINGHYLGKRAYGYSSFSYDLTPYLEPAGEDNLIAVRVDNSLQPNSRWYTGSGIYRNTWLRIVPEIHIEKWGIFVTTPQITKELAVIKAEISIENEKEPDSAAEINAWIIDSHGKKVSDRAKSNVTNNMASLEIALMNPELWDIYQPNMYTLVTELRTNGKIAEVRKTQFGVRSYYFDADNGFFLNGKNVEIRGVNMHHDLGALGAAVNIRAMERQLEIMKGMGVNAIRTAHNPPAPELLDLCDQMGLLVMDEAFDVWTKGKKRNDYHIDFKENHEADLRDMILRDRNHPSVFMWSIGNEIPEQFDSLGLSITCELASIVKSMDTTRPVTCALTETDPAKNFIYQSGCLDVLGFNYKIFDWKNFKKNFPGQKMLAAENMSAYSTRGHYDMPSDSVRYWPRTYTEEIIGPNPDFTVSAYDNVCAYWGATHEATLRELYKHNFIAGMFIWSGFDFIGEPVPYEWPAKSSYYGVVDLAGFPKDIYHLYRSIWTGDTVLHVFPHWNWEEGQLVDIWAFYNHADEVELFLNNKSLGAKSKGPEDFHVMWRIPFEPGTLKAISRINGTVVQERIINTSGAPARIELVADREDIETHRDLGFITVNILDEAGNLVPYADNEVSFEIEGPGIIAGVDNGYQASHEPFKASKRKAWKGKCLAIIESGKEEGTITLKATSGNLKGSEIEITVNNSL